MAEQNNIPKKPDLERKEDNSVADSANKKTEKKSGLRAPVKPAIAWSACGVTLALAIVLALIFWL